MTNLDKWMLYNDGLSSPESYLRWGWLYVVSASLQRRVWCPPDHARCYPNQYITLIGRPGIGKGLVLGAVNGILTEHKMTNKGREVAATEDEKALIDEIKKAELENARAENEQKFGKSLEVPLLLPNGGDAGSYEGLLRSMSTSSRIVEAYEYDEKTQKMRLRAKSHCSMYFCLEEIDSLLAKDKDKLVKFLLTAYDCKEEYKYVVKTTGKSDRILRPCLNFLAGTTPDNIQEMFTEQLLTGGFSSRTFFIYATKNRKNTFFIPALTPEQAAAKQEVIKHSLALTKLYGQITLDDGVEQWLQKWWDNYENNPKQRISQSPKLIPYYARKNIHVMKVAMALHFGESIEMRIPRHRFEEAIEWLNTEEKTMHLALSFGGNNPMTKISYKILALLRGHKRTHTEILVECIESGHGDRVSIDQALEYLTITDQITFGEEMDEELKKQMKYYKVK